MDFPQTLPPIEDDDQPIPSGAEKPLATIRVSPSDFFVEEIPIYTATGEGGHVFVKIQKTNWSTLACIQRMAKELGKDPDSFGHAGMKDRHAVTIQTLSFPWEVQEPLPDFSELEAEGIDVLGMDRHPHKLRVGHLLGNRFVVVLREIDPGTTEQVLGQLEQVSRTGVPNAYGPQRFGRDGRNPERALAWLRGESRGPKDKRTRKLLFSSVQSMLFDRLLAKRVANGTWDTVLAGDLVKTVDHGGLFLSEDAAVDAQRAKNGEVTATGPIFGPRMRWPEGQPAQWEQEVLEKEIGNQDALANWGKLGAGSRRALRIVPKNLEYTLTHNQSTPTLTVSMVLPKGAYVTTVLGTVFSLRDASIPTPVASKAGTVPDSSPHDELLRDRTNSSR